MLGVTSASSPIRRRTRRLTASSTSIVPAAAASATGVPASEASQPQKALPSAMAACTAMRFIATARARTQAGAVVWVPADRLEKTPVQAAPVQTAPRSATAV